MEGKKVGELPNGGRARASAAHVGLTTARLKRGLRQGTRVIDGSELEIAFRVGSCSVNASEITKSAISSLSNLLLFQLLKGVFFLTRAALDKR